VKWTERLHTLLDEARVDCYNKHEEFVGVLCTLGDELRSPLKATVVGELVEENGKLWTHEVNE
jgi:hypothetical protein